MAIADSDHNNKLTQPELFEHMELACLMIGCDSYHEHLRSHQKKAGLVEELDEGKISTHEEL